VLKPDQIGTLEAGKVADMVLIDGNPLNDVTDLLNVLITFKGGRIVADHRTTRK
jgi:imidazolonepropionase-like amidohydrolase